MGTDDESQRGADGGGELDSLSSGGDRDAEAHEHATFHHEQQVDEAERQHERFEEEHAERSALSAEMERELWQESQYSERIAEGQEFRDRGEVNGEVEELEDIGDRRCAVVSDGDEFTVVEVDQSTDLEIGDQVNAKLGQTKGVEPTVEKVEPEQSKGLER